MSRRVVCLVFAVLFAVRLEGDKPAYCIVNERRFAHICFPDVTVQ
jgi:hypothetical protein